MLGELVRHLVDDGSVDALLADHRTEVLFDYPLEDLLPSGRAGAGRRRRRG